MRKTTRRCLLAWLFTDWRVEGKRKEKKKEKCEKRDKVLECRDELSAGRRRRLSRRLYLTKLSTEEERRALLQPGKLYRGSEVPGGRGASFRKLAGRRKREVTSWDSCTLEQVFAKFSSLPPVVPRCVARPGKITPQYTGFHTNQFAS